MLTICLNDFEFGRSRVIDNNTGHLSKNWKIEKCQNKISAPVSILNNVSGLFYVHFTTTRSNCFCFFYWL